MSPSATMDLPAAQSPSGKPPSTWGELIPPVLRVQIAILAGLILLAYWVPIRRDLWMRWTGDGNWSHGAIVPLFSLYFITTRKRELLRTVARPDYIGGVLLVLAALALYLVGVLYFRYFQAFSLVVLIFGVTLLMGGWPIIRIAWFPILFLLLAVPIPTFYFVKLTMPLRVLGAWVSASILPLMINGLMTEAQATVIDYFYKGNVGTLNVEEACSGLRLMMSFVALGVAMAYLDRKRPAWQRVVMILSCVPIAVVCNIVRVTVTGVLHVTGHKEWAEGTPHQLLGILMLVLAFALFAAIGHVLSNLFVESPDEPETAAPS